MRSFGPPHGTYWREMRKAIRPGEQVRYRDCRGEWHDDGIADSEEEPTHVADPSRRSGKRRVHDFPVVWVLAPRADGAGTVRVPWPAEDVGHLARDEAANALSISEVEQ